MNPGTAPPARATILIPLSLLAAGLTGLLIAQDPGPEAARQAADVVQAAPAQGILAGPVPAIRIEVDQDPELQVAPPRRVVRGGQLIVARAALINDLSGARAPGDSDDSDFHLGATLKTDLDLESVLEKAARYQADGNWNVATQLWQAVLERSGQALVSNDGRLYRSMSDLVEETLCGLPADGLAVYRIKADAAARGLLAAAGDPWDEAALGKVASSYFPSSLGDNAAFRLAALLMDRHEFVGAQRLLEKILHLHPDPDVDPGQVAVRLALCQAWLGDSGLALQTLEGEPRAVASSAGQQLAAMLRDAGAGPLAGSRGGREAFEGFRVQPALPRDFFQKPLIAAWQFGIDPEPVIRPEDAPGRITRAPPNAEGEFASGEIKTSEKNLHKQWAEQVWRPAGTLALADGRIWFRSAANLSCWNSARLNQPEWRSAWINRFELDQATAALEMYRRQWANNRFPVTASARGRHPESEVAVQLFGDRIHSSLRLADGVVYCIEGPTVEGRERPNRNPQAIAWNVRMPRARTNFLAAYEAATGRALWKIPQERGRWNPSAPPRPEGNGNNPVEPQPAAPNSGAEAGKAPGTLADGGFMGPPEVAEGRIYVPVSHGGAISVFCLDAREGGRILWQTWLCDEPESGAAPWSPIVLTRDGSDLFVGSGMGVVFCLDRMSGDVRFAIRYPRNGTPNMALRNFGLMMNTLNFDGWNEDLLIPWGRQLICLASDASRIFAVDRSSGALIWEVDMQPLGARLDYVLGIHDRVLYAAGWETIVAFDLEGQGRMLWGGDRLFGNQRSFGMGALTPDGILMPVADQVWLFPLRPGQSMPEPLARAPVNTGYGAPVGNLYSDGTALWAHGGNRFLKLVPETDSQRVSRREPSTQTEDLAGQVNRTTVSEEPLQ